MTVLIPTLVVTHIAACLQCPVEPTQNHFLGVQRRGSDHNLYPVLLEELDHLAEAGCNVQGRLFISDSAHLIMPYHKRIDHAREARKKGDRIGTTGRGIGPTYEDKASRHGIRFAELLDEALFPKWVERILEEKNFYLTHYFSEAPMDAQTIIAEYRGYAEKLAPFVGDVSAELEAAMKAGKQILFEGAQGTHLDIDHGTYPYVTSSNTVAGNACCGAGVGPKAVTGVIGIAKAYTTRVGMGPFPSELSDATGDYIQSKGAEFGATTGRRRRCGWLDIVLLKNAARLNGLTGLAITKLDVLGGLKELRICTAYSCEKKHMTAFPANLRVLETCRPIYETLPGWDEDISTIRTAADLPAATRNYLKRIEALTELPIDIISVGPDRKQTIVTRNPFL